MSNGRFIVKKGNRTFIVEPISKFPDRNSGWTNGGIDKIRGGAILEEESEITEENCKNIVTLKPGESPIGYIDELLKDV